MAVNDIVPAAGEYLEDTLAAASPDLLRTMIREFAQRMMDAEVEQLCGAGYGEVSSERVNTRRDCGPASPRTKQGDDQATTRRTTRAAPHPRARAAPPT